MSVVDNAVNQAIEKIISVIPEHKKKEIKERIRSGDYPRTRAEAEWAESFEDYVGSGIFWGLISAPRRNSHRLAKDDVLYSAELLDLPLAANLQALPGLQLAEFWSLLLQKISKQ
ncbi:MAG: hypothetical protein RXO36_07450 [Candidatus Nanopusillus acidilobi]